MSRGGAKLSVRLLRPPASGEESYPGEGVATMYAAITFDMRVGWDVGRSPLTDSNKVGEVVVV
jgi:hypothetical protein